MRLKIEKSEYNGKEHYICYICSAPFNNKVQAKQISKNDVFYIDVCGSETCINIVIFKQEEIFK